MLYVCAQEYSHMHNHVAAYDVIAQLKTLDCSFYSASATSSIRNYVCLSERPQNYLYFSHDSFPQCD